MIWIAGLPLTTWLLLLASFGVGLILSVLFYFSHRGRQKISREEEP